MGESAQQERPTDSGTAVFSFGWGEVRTEGKNIFLLFPFLLFVYLFVCSLFVDDLTFSIFLFTYSLTSFGSFFFSSFIFFLIFPFHSVFPVRSPRPRRSNDAVPSETHRCSQFAGCEADFSGSTSLRLCDR